MKIITFALLITTTISVQAQSRMQPSFWVSGGEAELESDIAPDGSLGSSDNPLYDSGVGISFEIGRNLYLVGSSKYSFGEDDEAKLERFENRIGVSAPYRPHQYVEIRPFIDYQYNRTVQCPNTSCEDSSVTGTHYGAQTRTWLIPGRFDVSYQASYLNFGEDRTRHVFSTGVWLSRSTRIGFKYTNSEDSEAFNATIEWY